MAGPIKFHSEQNLQPLDCGQCEALFAEVLDQADGRGEALDPTTTAGFDAHVASCAPCASLLAEARRGHDWLRLLSEDVVTPPLGLVSRILAQTTGHAAAQIDSTPMPLVSAGALAASGPSALDVAIPQASTNAAKSEKNIWSNINLVAMAHGARRTISEPRFLMTAAMAFFSITLTFNLLGIHVTEVRPGDLKPTNLVRSISRQYTETNARVTRYYDNLKIVYELEARVREFRRNSDTDSNRKRDVKPGGSGPSSQTETPATRNDHMAGDKQTVSPDRDDPEPAVIDSTLREVALRHPQAHRNSNNSSENLKLQAVCQRRLV